MSPRTLLRWAARAGIAGAVLVGLLWVRCLAEARLELSRAEQAVEPGERVEALARAVRWTAPLNPYASDALDGLLAHAARQREQGDHAGALRAYRSARGSLVASAGLVQLRRAALAEIDQALTQLAPRDPSAPAGRASHRAAHQVPWARAMALAGFVLWVAAAFALAHLGGRAGGRPRIACGAALVVGLSCCGAGLWLS